MKVLAPAPEVEARCGACRDGHHTPIPMSMAFQPIVDVEARTIFAYEALVRGLNEEPALSVLQQVNDGNRYAFDQSCRVTAIRLATSLGLANTGSRLSVNFMPKAVYSPLACIQKTLQAARDYNFPLHCLMFELTEDERVQDMDHMQEIMLHYKRQGFTMAIDDFGSGHSGLGLLSDLCADVVKIDGHLVRDMQNRPRARQIIRSTVQMCDALGAKVIAECVETPAEYDTLRECGVSLMQGYLFARPAFESLPEVVWP